MQELNETKQNKKLNKNKTGKQAKQKEIKREEAIARQQANLSKYETELLTQPKNKELKQKVEKARLTLEQVKGKKWVQPA